MATEERLSRFVEEALRAGVTRAQIGQELAAAGWRREAIAEALGAFADSSLPLPVPRPRPYLSAKEAFLYLVLFTALYLTAWNLGTLLFELIENRYPDAVADYRGRGTDDTLRWAVAWLVVAFPVFLGLSDSLEKSLRSEPGKRASRVRKWLTYLTLYVAATTILGDVATLIHNLLGGELTTRFLLKAATIAGIAGSIFGYYLVELRREEREDT
jgi:Domain of unknown function (DUF5671)